MKNKNSKKYLKVLAILGAPILVATAILTPIYISSLAKAEIFQHSKTPIEFSFSSKSMNTIESILSNNDVIQRGSNKAFIDDEILLQNIVNAIEIDDNYLIQELQHIGKEQPLKIEISRMIIDYYNQEKEINSNLRHGWVFSGHFWQAVSFQSLAGAINFLVVANFGIQSVQIIIGAIAGAKTGEFSQMVESMAGCDAMPKWLFDTIKDGTTRITHFKANSNCTWPFWIGINVI